MTPPKTVETAIAAIEANGWRWTLDRPFMMVPSDEEKWSLRITRGDSKSGEHHTFEGPRLTIVLAEAVVYSDRRRGVGVDD